MLTVGILLGRLAGLVREVTLASVLGASDQADVAVLVLTFPDVLTAFLLSGAVSAVLVPEFTRRIAQGGARATFRDAELVVAGAALVLGAVVALAAGPLVGLLGPGLPRDSQGLASELVAISAFALPLTALAAVATAYLQSHRRFLTTALGTLIVNVILIAVLALAVRPGSLAPLAIGIVVAGAARWLVQRVDAARLRDAEGASSLREDLRRFGGRYGLAIAGTSALVLLPFAMRSLASLGGTGDVAIVNYALRILELPLGAFITVGSIAALPFLAELIARGDQKGAVTLFRQLVLLTQIGTVPLALGGILAAGPIALALYGRPAVGAAVVDIGAFAAIGMASLPAQGLSSVAQAYLVARGRLAWLLAINGIGLAGYVVLGAFLVATVGTRGVMLAYVMLHWSVMLALLISAARDGAPIGAVLARDMVIALVVAGTVLAVFFVIATALHGSAILTFALAATGAVLALMLSLLPNYGGLAPRAALRSLFARQ